MKVKEIVSEVMDATIKAIDDKRAEIDSPMGSIVIDRTKPEGAAALTVNPETNQPTLDLTPDVSGTAQQPGEKPSPLAAGAKLSVKTDEGISSEVEEFFHKVAQDGDYDMLYDAQMGKYGKDIEKAVQDMYDDVSINSRLHPDDDFEEIYDRMLDQIEQDYGDSDADSEPHGSYDSSDDADALASAGFGSDEDYGDFGGNDYEESAQLESLKKLAGL